MIGYLAVFILGVVVGSIMIYWFMRDKDADELSVMVKEKQSEIDARDVEITETHAKVEKINEKIKRVKNNDLPDDVDSLQSEFDSLFN